ncbi:hypothetical protein MLD38_004020 [Melastoma candidum]|uniref:Uncharacterized protein n=1 Tax=Melastoma candidum TaxID=119954 RepID=A0ACB9S6C1_9MYRT|nr:hypothetical protein MLD38_004020 [Melastoma candidum]
MSTFIPPPTFLIFLVLVLVLPVVLTQDLPSPSPGPAAADSSSSSSPISSPPTTSQSYSPPSPPPAESPSPTPSLSPSPAPSPSKSPTPSPSPDSSDLSHTGVLDDNSADAGKSEGMSGGKKAGIAFAVILFAVAVVFGGIVYKKRRENIRRQQYAYSGRGGIQL